MSHSATLPAASWRELLTGRNGLLSAVLTGGVCLYAINTYLTATMLPSIVSDIGGRDYYAWNTTLFVLAAILSAATSGLVMHRFGPRRAYALASGIFFVGSLLAAVAPNMAVMLLGRTIQGAGGGMMFTLCYAMIMWVFPERLWPRAMALLSGVFGIAILIGPAVGGIFAEMGSWRMGFVALLPVIVAFVLMTHWVLPKSQPAGDGNQPLPMRQLMLLAGLVLALSVGSTLPSIWAGVVSIVLSLVCLWGIAVIEQHSAVRIFPRGTFTFNSPLFLTFASLSLLIMCVASEFFVPYFLQVLHGQGPLMAGYLAALMSLGWVAAEILSARWMGVSMHRAVAFGPGLIVLGMLGLAVSLPLQSEGALGVLLAISLSLVLIGFGIGMGWPHLSTFALQFSPEADKNIAASALSTVQMFAIALGSALAGLVVNSAGFGDAQGVAGASRSAISLFLVFTVFAGLAVLSARQIVRHLKAIGQLDLSVP